MKLALDLLPVLVFTGAFQAAEARIDGATGLANKLLGAGVPGGSIGPAEAPVLLATSAAVLTTLLQVCWLRLRHRRVDALLWFSLAAVLVLGGATLLLRDPGFIKWKPSVLYWSIGLALWLSPLLAGRNLVRTLLGSRYALPEWGWHRLNFAWIAFFAMMGLLNLWVAYSVSTSAWVAFKLGAGLAVLLLFTLGQGLLLSRFARTRGSRAGHMPIETK
jgi:intracellular septation protein